MLHAYPMRSVRSLVSIRLPCLFCGLKTSRDRVCRQCLDILPRNVRFCIRCGQQVPGQAAGSVSCADCQASPPVFDKARAPLLYEFPVDVVLKKLKFSRQTAFAAAFAEIMVPCLEAEFPDCDALVPVPLHAFRHFRRGFNQADEICRPVAKATGLPEIKCVKRRRATQPQTGLDPAARRRNLAGAFAVTESVRFRRPVIVDDVITTGATSSQLAGVLLEAGAERVGVLAVARA